jgi:hypothetical protein
MAEVNAADEAKIVSFSRKNNFVSPISHRKPKMAVKR